VNVLIYVSVAEKFNPYRIKKQNIQDQFKKQYIIHTLVKMNWRKTETALVLGIDRTSLFRQMKSFGLE